MVAAFTLRAEPGRYTKYQSIIRPVGNTFAGRRFKPHVFQNENGAHQGRHSSFGSGSAFIEKLDLYAEPFPLVA